MSQLLKPWVRNTLKIHAGQGVFDGRVFRWQVFNPACSPIIESVAFLVFLWLICWWMYRRKIFLKI
jgi:hypothetical protein